MSVATQSPSPEPVQRIKAKKGTKNKSKRKAAAKAVAERGKDEGTNLHWDYVPPEGAILVDHNIDCGDFDWDEVKNNEDLELWLVRAPAGVSFFFAVLSIRSLYLNSHVQLKTKYMENFDVDIPSSSCKVDVVRVMDRKNISYDIWSLGDDNERILGEESAGSSCLLPKKRKNGKLYQGLAFVECALAYFNTQYLVEDSTQTDSPSYRHICPGCFGHPGLVRQLLHQTLQERIKIPHGNHIRKNF